MLRLAGLALLVTALFVPAPTAAQAEPGFPELLLDPPNVSANGTVPIAPAEASLRVPWELKFPTAASAAAASSGETTIEWDLQCSGEFLTLRASPTVVPVEPTGDSFEGIAILNISAKADSPGLKSLACKMQGTATAPGWPQPILGTADFAPQVAFVGAIHVDAPMPSREAGPDKMIRYEVNVENLGNARILVTFSMADRPKGRWDILLPDPLVLDSALGGGGQNVGTVQVAVATSYHNGPNKDAKDFVILVTSQSADQPEVTGQEAQVTLHSKVQGWYIPGPSPITVIALLALGAVVVRRRD